MLYARVRVAVVIEDARRVRREAALKHHTFRNGRVMARFHGHLSVAKYLFPQRTSPPQPEPTNMLYRALCMRLGARIWEPTRI